ncbi:hypothetical protein [Streptomyces sp. AC495_CC817]|uniref:hypothetical protein n=1 Tax=Streptomyces sp. AC495_CC817 TaxID=2823900 RepID=UPI001C25CD7B|nr:hypothetical protein [Streptomyces sp. AC495_CC817]
MHNSDGKDSQEQQLRELLERTVPLLQAPPDRMRQVHRRVVARSRRRKAVGATVTGVTAIALLYGTLGSQLFGVHTSPRTQVGSPSSEEYRINLSDGTLGIALPHGWSVRDQADRPNTATVFVANRPLGATKSCPSTRLGEYDCAPLSTLAEGEALISFRLTERPQAIDSGTKVEPSPYSSPGEGCRSLGGDQELVRRGWTARPDEASFPVDAHVCLRGASAATLTEVTGILDTATFDPGRA